jgi:carbon storage regulator
VNWITWINREDECHFRLYRASIPEIPFPKRVARHQQDRRPTNVIHTEQPRRFESKRSGTAARMFASITVLHKNNELAECGLSEPWTGSHLIVALSHNGKAVEMRCALDFVTAFKGPSTMITLTRRVNESVLINEDIRVTVVHLKNHRVRLQIDAPSNMSVRRERSELDDQDPADATPLQS